MIKVGSVVRYAREWCTETERKYVHIVVENRGSRWLIERLGTGMFVNPVEEVEEYMIEEVETC